MALLLVVACGDDDDGGQQQAGGADGRIERELSPSDPSPTDPVTGEILLDTSLETTYYDVEGTTTEAIFSHIEQNGPTDGAGKRGSGLTTVNWGYEWQGGPEVGECSIRGMTIKADMVVTLPQHVDVDSLPADIRGNWENYAASVATHEQTHVDIYEQGAEQIRQRMLAIGPQPSCDELETDIKNVWSEEQASINNQQDMFHQQEFDRLAQRRAPIEAQINANRDQISALQRQIETLDGVVKALRNEIDSLLREIDGVDQAILDVNQSNESSQDKQAKLVVLVQQRNALQERHNAAVDEYNEALAQREPLVAQRSQLIDETNKLVDEFNWTR
jgi:predicted secreted Zn-dependent protease